MVHENPGQDVSPLKNALDTVEAKNAELKAMINEFRCRTNENYQALSMTLGSVALSIETYNNAQQFPRHIVHKLIAISEF